MRKRLILCDSTRVKLVEEAHTADPVWRPMLAFSEFQLQDSDGEAVVVPGCFRCRRDVVDGNRRDGRG